MAKITPNTKIKINYNTLLKSINEELSEYEERHVKWVSIGYDKKKLLELLYELKFLKEQDIPNEKRITLLEQILNDNDIEHLHKLLINDTDTARFALIEKYARKAAMEMLVRGKYTIKTLNVITQLPLPDYQLTVKRIQEIMNLVSDITTQISSAPGGVAGI